MKLRKKNNKNIYIYINILIILIFGFFLIKYDQKEKIGIQKTIAADISINEEDFNGKINLTELGINEDDIKFIYIVEEGDNLSSISEKFNIPIEKIKKINKLKSNIIKPGDKLIITEEEGFIYKIKNKTTLRNFSEKYNLDIQLIKAYNYITEDEAILDEGDELFIPISEKEGIEKGLLPKPVEKKIENKKNNNQKQKNNPSKKRIIIYNKSKVVNSYRYNNYIKNGFVPGHCTRYVAIKKFPYIDSNTQKRLWGGNAKEWYYNAKAAGYPVGKTPKVGSIVVFHSYENRLYSIYGHVGIVIDIDYSSNKILIEEMNYAGRFVVTKRWIDINHQGILGYIYY